MKISKREWKRAWACLAEHTGGDTQQLNGYEAWQYMGTHDGQHEFRHRAHPVLGRTVWTTPALETRRGR